MCRVCGIWRSGYYAWRQREKSRRQKENEQLVEKIQNVYAFNRKVYGSPRITEELKAQGLCCDKNRVARLMRLNGIRAKTVKRYKVTTHTLPIAPNLVSRRFAADECNKLWVSDISYIATREGLLLPLLLMSFPVLSLNDL
jgi:putative transposase